MTIIVHKLDSSCPCDNVYNTYTCTDGLAVKIAIPIYGNGLSLSLTHTHMYQRCYNEQGICCRLMLWENCRHSLNHYHAQAVMVYQQKTWHHSYCTQKWHTLLTIPSRPLTCVSWCWSATCSTLSSWMESTAVARPSAFGGGSWSSSNKPSEESSCSCARVKQ